MKKTGVTFLIVLLMFTLGSCRMLEFDSDALLTPPQMNAADRDLLRAVDSVSSSYILAYPKSGSYQNAITSFDIDGDGENEAICFYTDGSEKTVKFIVLEMSDGKWSVKATGSSGASAVERMSFCDIDGDGVNELIIGWQFLSGEEKALEIFGFDRDEEMKSLYTGMFNNFLVFDDKVVIISRNTGRKTASASVVGKGQSGVSVLTTATLNNSITSFINVQSGELNDSKRAIFIDEQLENLSYTTEVLTLGEKGELIGSPEDVSIMTTRTRAYVCTDINGDKRLDLPVERPLPEYVRAGVTENLSYVDWYGFDGTATSLILSGYVSVNEQFMIVLPDAWIGNITVQRDPEAERTVRFFAQTDAGNSPMFSVRVFSQQEFSEVIKDTGWTVISNSGENVYTYKNDGAPEGFETSAEQITEAFILLT